MSEPIDHHYVPVFYLSRWVGTDNQLCRFSRPRGPEVKAKRVGPRGTAFEPGLYANSAVPPEQAQEMESKFMASLDTQASEALALLEAGLPEKEWTSGPRSAWSRFMLAQMLRAPEDIAQLKSSVTQSWSAAEAELEEKYAAKRKKNDPLTLKEYLAQQTPGEAEDLALGVSRKLMNHEKICQIFNNMHWLVLDFSDDVQRLLTSDRPVWMTASIDEDDAFLTMPIGPRKLFAAARHPETYVRLKVRDRRELAQGVNVITAQHAVKFVYGLDDELLAMVQKHFATRRHSSLLERLALKHGHKIVAPDSPAATLGKAD